MTILLETVTGKLIDPINPQVDQVNIEDIAWALSRMSRFCGHTITVVPYNVAQHSVFVAKKVDQLLTENNWEEIKHLNLHMRTWEDWVFDELAGIKRKIILKALLHDASEIYTGDLPSPIKQLPELKDVIKNIEHRLTETVYKAFGLEMPDSDEYKLIKYADKVAQKIEAHAFMQSRGKHWAGLPDVSLEDLQKFPAPMASLDAYKLFKETFKQYYGE